MLQIDRARVTECQMQTEVILKDDRSEDMFVLDIPEIYNTEEVVPKEEDSLITLWKAHLDKSADERPSSPHFLEKRHNSWDRTSLAHLLNQKVADSKRLEIRHMKRNSSFENKLKMRNVEQRANSKGSKYVSERWYFRTTTFLVRWWLQVWKKAKQGG